MTAQLNAFGLVTQDMARSLAFYRQLGLDIPVDADQQPHVEVELAGGMRLMWDSVAMVRSLDPDWSPPSGSARMSLAFQCDGVADVDRVHAEMVAAGYSSEMDPWDAAWGMRYAVLADPDGNGVDLYAPLSDRA